ncbi:MAG: type II secretion system protein [Planctomycetota bacterium]
MMRSSRILAHSRNARRRGLTLIELVVVLTILVALGSILVPIIGNALTRSHVATCATNIPEISKALIFAQATSGDFGDGWTTGVFASGTVVNNSALIAFGGDGSDTLVAAVLTADEVSALNDLGITNVFEHGDPGSVDGWDVTFNSNLTTTTLDTTTPIITLNAAQVSSLNLPAAGAGEKYIWLGIDETWSLLGTITTEPPVHFGDTDGAYPNQVYSRFGAIFLLTEDDAGAADNEDASAAFQMVSYNLEGGDGFETADNHIGIHWDEVQE